MRKHGEHNDTETHNPRGLYRNPVHARQIGQRHSDAHLYMPLLKTFGTMRIMTSRTVVFLVEAQILHATGSVMIPCSWLLLTCHRIIIEPTEPLLPTPRSATSTTYDESAPCLQTACKDIVARIILKAPACAPGALFGITHALAAGFFQSFRSGSRKKSGASLTVSRPRLNTNRYPKSSTRFRIVDPVCSST